MRTGGGWNRHSIVYSGISDVEPSGSATREFVYLLRISVVITPYTLY
jgi:hypothetical protein